MLVLQVKNEVQPIQEAEAARIKSEVAVFARRVTDYQKGFRTRSFYKYSTGAQGAYPEIDQASCSSVAVLCVSLNRNLTAIVHPLTGSMLRHADHACQCCGAAQGCRSTTVYHMCR